PGRCVDDLAAAREQALAVLVGADAVVFLADPVGREVDARMVGIRQHDWRGRLRMTRRHTSKYQYQGKLHKAHIGAETKQEGHGMHPAGGRHWSETLKA